MAFTVSRNLLTKVPVGRVLYLGLLLGVSLGGASAVAPSLVQKCSSSENPNNSSVPMVTPRKYLSLTYVDSFVATVTPVWSACYPHIISRQAFCSFLGLTSHLFIGID